MYGAGAAWSRLFLPGAGAGADPSRSEPESAPGPWRPGAGAAQKSGGSATLAIFQGISMAFFCIDGVFFFTAVQLFNIYRIFFLFSRSL